MQLFDSHAHYNDSKFDEDRETVINRTLQNGVSHFIVAGYNVESSRKAVEIANQYPMVFATIGISPNDVGDSLEEKKISFLMQELEKMLAEKDKSSIVAVGEIGLDYYWNQENKKLQKEMFKKQIELANKYQLPIVIHTREAVMDTLDILKQYPVEKKGIFHCCPLNPELVKEALKLGYAISLSGVITFKNAKNAEAIIQMIPEERLLIETDSPYLAPEPIRGTRNECSNVRYVAEKIANIKNKTIEEIANITNQNAKKIFQIKNGEIF